MRLPRFLPVLVAGAVLAVAGCEAARPIRLSPPAAHRPAVRAREPARVQRCEPPGRSRLSDTEKNRLFDDFDSWKEERRAPGEATGASVPPPAPQAGHPGAPACRVSRS